MLIALKLGFIGLDGILLNTDKHVLSSDMEQERSWKKKKEVVVFIEVGGGGARWWSSISSITHTHTCTHTHSLSLIWTQQTIGVEPFH